MSGAAARTGILKKKKIEKINICKVGGLHERCVNTKKKCDNTNCIDSHRRI